MRITRRQFLKYCSIAAGALGLSAGTLLKLEKALADTANLSVGNIVWVSGQSCSGCITSLLNTVTFRDIGSFVLDDIDILFQETVAASCGATLNGDEIANAVTENTRSPESPYFLLVEGAIPDGNYCRVGKLANISDETMYAQVRELAGSDDCLAVVAIGTCASWGGIPAAKGNVTGARGIQEVLADATAINKKVVKLPGCPPHPDWMVGTVIKILTEVVPLYLGGADLTSSLAPLDLIEDGTGNLLPRAYYGEMQCNAGPCTWRYNNNDAADRPGYLDHDNNYGLGNSLALGANIWQGTDYGCLGILGCKGRKTRADCSARKWNSYDTGEAGANWCVGSRAGCHGCTHKTFPDGVGKFFTFR
jgi:hydrogenase small subunit